MYKILFLLSSIFTLIIPNLAFGVFVIGLNPAYDRSTKSFQSNDFSGTALGLQGWGGELPGKITSCNLRFSKHYERTGSGKVTLHSKDDTFLGYDVSLRGDVDAKRSGYSFFFHFDKVEPQERLFAVYTFKDNKAIFTTKTFVFGFGDSHEEPVEMDKSVLTFITDSKISYIKDLTMKTYRTYLPAALKNTSSILRKLVETDPEIIKIKNPVEREQFIKMSMGQTGVEFDALTEADLNVPHLITDISCK